MMALAGCADMAGARAMQALAEEGGATARVALERADALQGQMAGDLTLYEPGMEYDIQVYQAWGARGYARSRGVSGHATVQVSGQGQRPAATRPTP